jgi:hypothetical protein
MDSIVEQFHSTDQLFHVWQPKEWMREHFQTLLDLESQFTACSLPLILILKSDSNILK